MSEIGERLRALRKLYRYSQQKLSDATGNLVSQSVIHYVESGRTQMPNMATIELLAPAFGMEPAELYDILTGRLPLPESPYPTRIGPRQTRTPVPPTDERTDMEKIADLLEAYPELVRGLAKLAGSQPSFILRTLEALVKAQEEEERRRGEHHAANSK